MKKKILIDTNKVLEDLQKSNNKLDFKNYSEMCEYLQLPLPSGGKQKQLQLKKLNKYLKYQKNDDNSYSIYNAFFPISDYDNKDLKELTKYAILSYILFNHSKNQELVDVEQKHSRMSVPIGNLATLIGYVTNKYFYYKKHPNELSYATSIPLKTINEVLDKIGDLYYRYVESSLTSLEKYKFIALEKIYYGTEMITDYQQYDKKTEYDDIFEKQCVFTKIQDKRRLTDEEIVVFQKLEKETFFEVMCKSKKFVEKYSNYDLSSKIGQNIFLSWMELSDLSMTGLLFSHHQIKLYYKLLSKKVYKELHLTSAFCSYDIIYNVDNIKDAFNCSLNNFFDIKKIVNKNAYLKLLNNTCKRHEREKTELDENFNSLINNEKYSGNIVEDLITTNTNKNIINLETFDVQHLLPILMFEDISKLSDDDFSAELTKIQKQHNEMIKKLDLEDKSFNENVNSKIRKNQNKKENHLVEIDI